VDMNTQRIESIEPIRTSSCCLAIADASYIVDEALFTIDTSAVKINNFQGTQKGMINFSEAEGLPQLMDINGRYLAIITHKGCIKIVNVHAPTKPKVQVTGNLFQTSLRIATNNNNNNNTNNDPVLDQSVSGSSKSGKQPRQSSSTSSSATTAFPVDVNTTRVRQVRVNASGTLVVLLCDSVETSSLSTNFPDTRLFVFDAVRGALSLYDFAAHKRFPVNILWDESDDRLFACEAHKLRESTAAVVGSGAAVSNNKKSSQRQQLQEDEEERDEDGRAERGRDAEAQSEVFLMFATSEQGILMQDSLNSGDTFGPLIGFNVPRVLYRKANRLGRHNDDDERRFVLFLIGSLFVRISNR
jgi:hypothetical protein